MEKISIDAAKLHVVSDAEAKELFAQLLGRGTTWASELMQYRTTSEFQEDWVIEAGNWLASARRLGFLDQVLGNVRGRREAPGLREAGDPVHRSVAQWLAHAMIAHYFVGTGWTFIGAELDDLSRADGTRADIDLRLASPDGCVVDVQLKAPGTLGLHDNEVDRHIVEAVVRAAAQLPDPAVGPSLIVLAAQRGWPLSGDIDAVEHLIGSTCQYEDGQLLLHDSNFGEMRKWEHVSAIVLLDYCRWLDAFTYGCTVLLNPWTYQPSDPSWFPYARVLECRDGVFTWHRGPPNHSTFGHARRPARIAPGRDDIP